MTTPDSDLSSEDFDCLCRDCLGVPLKSKAGSLTQEDVRRAFVYENGHLIKVGDPLGRPYSNNGIGYRQIVFMGKHHLEHRLIWLYHNGYLPPVIDHIDRDTENNRIENLRASSKSENAFNSGLPKNNKSGVKGVKSYKGKWIADIWCKNVFYHLGTFKNKEDAVAARKAAEHKHFGHLL